MEYLFLTSQDAFQRSAPEYSYRVIFARYIPYHGVCIGTLTKRNQLSLMNSFQRGPYIRALPYAVGSALLLVGCGSATQTAEVSHSPSTTSQLATASASPVDSAPPTESTSTPPESSSSASEPAPAETTTATGEATSAPSLTPPVNDGFTIDPASIVTTDLVAQTNLADPAGYQFEAADQPSVVFQTPDSSIACLMQSYGVFCMTDDSKNWVLQSVSMAPGDTLPRTVQARGRAATHDWFTAHAVLPEAQTLQWMGMSCTSTSPQSVQCSDGTTGFNLSNLEDR